MISTKLLVDTGSFLKRVWRLAVPYWKSEERAGAWLLLAAVVGLTLALVGIDVVFNYWNRNFYNSIQEKGFQDFKDLLFIFGFLAAIYIFGFIYRVYLQQMLQMRWRAWLTKVYVTEWFSDRAYYRLELERTGTDNPDQRISEDLNRFTSQTLSLGLGILSSVVQLASFAVILWSLSGALTVGGVTIPGYLFWVALVYSLVGSVLAHYVGRSLIRLNFQQERYEADFRFNLVRLRENAEGVALYRGEDQEQRGLLGRFGFVLENWWQIMRSTKRLNAFSAGYSQIAIVFPFIVAAPRYFSGEIDLGTLMQIGSAFGSVQTALSWFVSNYSSLAEWKAGVDRLLTFHEALTKARARQHQEVPATTASADDGALEVEHLALDLPNGRPILADAAFTIRPGDRVLVTGPSGIGKSTLFRALAGIWPFSRGRIRIPRGASLLFLPQKPYIPIGSLRESVAYPAPADAFTDDEVREALSAVRLDAFRERLDERTNWSMLMSGGEQQKLAIARALLHRPGWLFLDEATSALDEENEHHLYGLLASRLPRTTIVSVAHRPGVAQYHDRRLRFQADGNGSMQLVAG